MKIKTIIFDWSGVVKDAVATNLWINNKIFEKHKAKPLTLEEFRENWQQPYTLFYEKYLPDVSFEEGQRDYREAIFDANCPKSKAFSGMPELVRKLTRESVYLVVVASDLPETVLAEIKEYGLENIFDEIFTNVHDKTGTVENLIKGRNLDLENTFFIGDSNHEIEIAKKVGIKGIAVTWGFFTEQRLRSLDPDFIVHDANELEKILIR